MTLSRRRHFLRIQTAEDNAAKRLLRGAGWPGGQQHRSLRTEAGWDRLLQSTADVPALRGHLQRHYHVWKQAAQEVRDLDQALGQQGGRWRDELRRLQTVPGVGPIVALTAISVLADVSRFSSAKHVGSYAGLVPSTHQSGTHDAHGRITKRGSAELRSMLCEAAHHAFFSVGRKSSGAAVPGFRLSNSYAAESGRVMGLLLCVVVFVGLIWGLTRLPKI